MKTHAGKYGTAQDANCKEVEEVIEEIAENFYMITLPLPFRLEHVHVFALLHDDKVALFDTGLDTPQTLASLEKALERIGKSVRDIDHIFVTHYHADHCGIAGRLQGLSGAVVHMSAIDKQSFSNMAQAQLLLDKITDFYTRQGLTKDVIDVMAELLADLRKTISPLQHDTCRELDPYQEAVGDTVFEVLPTPGHTCGHVCFYFRKERILIAGDHVLPKITPNLSPDLFRPDFHPLECFLNSLMHVQDLPVNKVYPAHGGPFSNLKERTEEIIEHHHERKGIALDSLRGGTKTGAQISMDIFGTDLPEFDKFLALNETYVHLIELLKEGVIREKNNENHLYYTIA